MKLLGKYRNGNYNVTILSDGTKIRETEEDEFIATFPENIDIKITNQCDMHCEMCHEQSVPEGEHGDILGTEFIDTLHPYTELAIGGGNPLAHPDLIPFLEKLKEKKIIANITVNQVHFEREQKLLQELVDKELIHGLGISLVKPTPEFIDLVKQYKNAVIHVINGIVSCEDIKAMQNNNLKLLILGYKEFGRGTGYYAVNRQEVERKQELLRGILPDILDRFVVVSFDNLAIEQLGVRGLLSGTEWAEFYMGDDGKYTMYVDMVTKKYAKNSTSTIRYGLLDNIEDMFEKIKRGCEI